MLPEERYLASQYNMQPTKTSLADTTRLLAENELQTGAITPKEKESIDKDHRFITIGRDSMNKARHTIEAEEDCEFIEKDEVEEDNCVEI